jgi:hypothetical protein
VSARTDATQACRTQEQRSISVASSPAATRAGGSFATASGDCRLPIWSYTRLERTESEVSLIDGRILEGKCLGRFESARLMRAICGALLVGGGRGGRNRKSARCAKGKEDRPIKGTAGQKGEAPVQRPSVLYVIRIPFVLRPFPFQRKGYVMNCQQYTGIGSKVFERLWIGNNSHLLPA